MDRSELALFNDNTMKLGTFCQNVSQGTFMTTAEGTLTPTWAENARIATTLDAAGWEFLLPLGRWRGLGGQIDFNSRSLEVFTWASAVAAITHQIHVFCTAHVPIWHPLQTAKLSTTIDHVGNGRMGLNVVAGWNDWEFGMFGIGVRGHDDRYAVADEWMTIVKRIWTEHEPFDFDGTYYQLKSVFMEPKPIQQPYPVVVNAGQSDAGIRFGAKHADISFQSLTDHDAMAALVAKAKRAAFEVDKRDLGVIVPCPVICRDTEKEVQDYLKYVVDERGDWEAGRQLVEFMMGGDVRSVSYDTVHKLERDLISGWAGYQLFGTPEQIVDKLIGLSKIGVNGVALSWVDYEAGIENFNAKVLPLMEQAGLRKAYVPAHPKVAV